MSNHAVFVLDRTGSMSSIKDQTISSFNSYLDEIKKIPDLLFTLVQFESRHGIVFTHTKEPIASVPDLNADTYVLGDMTPLLEAAIKTIEATEKVVLLEDKVVVVILTDGHENASDREYTRERLAKLVQRKTADGWQFVFLGANMDAFAEASGTNIAAGQTMSYNAHDYASAGATLSAVAQNTRSFYAGAKGMSFSAEQRAKAQEDKVAPAPKAAKDDDQKGMLGKVKFPE